MSRPNFGARAGLQAALVVIVGLGAVYWAVEAGQRPVDRPELRIFASKLQSQSAEATDLAVKMARGDTGPDFALRHAAQLRKHTSQLAKELASTAKVTPRYNDTLQSLQRIATQLEEQLAKFQPGQGATANDLSALTQLTRQAEAIDKSLLQGPS